MTRLKPQFRHKYVLHFDSPGNMMKTTEQLFSWLKDVEFRKDISYRSSVFGD